MAEMGLWPALHFRRAARHRRRGLAGL